MTTKQTEAEKSEEGLLIMNKLSAEVLIKEIEEEVEECFLNDLTTQNEIYTRLFNHIQARFLYN